MLKQSDGIAVELFQARATNAVPSGAILFVHGNQGGLLLGAKEFVDSGALLRFSSGLTITAAAVSQPGFGASDGPPDFCGPDTQQAIVAALGFLKEQPSIDPTRIVLCGNSRGAVASAMVAAQVPDLRAVILSSGVYDLREAFKSSLRGIRQAIEVEAGLSTEAFLARSALHHVDKIRSEILLLHGRYDDRASVAQAEAFSKALTIAGVEVDLSVFECGHQIPREDSRRVIRPFLQKVFDHGVTRH